MTTAVEQTLDFIRGTKTAYQLTFQLNQPANVEVLADMARFCRATESCVVPGDHDKTLVLEGRREMWLRVQEYLNLTPEQLYALKVGNSPQQRK